MVRHWRASWAASSGTSPSFPFGVVQLAGCTGGDPLGLPRFQFIGQTQGTGSLPNAALPDTFLAPAFDLGDSSSPYGAVHCRNKVEIGQRLALGARKTAYGDRVTSGPTLSSATTAESAVVLTFDGVGDGQGLALLPMTISQEYNQTAWEGDTPFEVCRRPVPPPPPLACTTGALPRGDDLFVVNTTVERAAALCAANSSCAGFTLRAAGCDGANATVGQIYFKSRSAGVTADASWRSWLRRSEDPCGPMGDFDGWSPALPTAVTRASVTLGLSPLAGVPVAVRFAWRGYPCERLGCGLYAQAEGLLLPPPPFHAYIGGAREPAVHGSMSSSHRGHASDTPSRLANVEWGH